VSDEDACAEDDARGSVSVERWWFGVVLLWDDHLVGERRSCGKRKGSVSDGCVVNEERRKKEKDKRGQDGHERKEKEEECQTSEPLTLLTIRRLDAFPLPSSPHSPRKRLSLPLSAPSVTVRLALSTSLNILTDTRIHLLHHPDLFVESHSRSLYRSRITAASFQDINVHHGD
jgi:hypothetical protein